MRSQESGPKSCAPTNTSPTAAHRQITTREHRALVSSSAVPRRDAEIHTSVHDPSDSAVVPAEPEPARPPAVSSAARHCRAGM
ncbi:hypothetical protein GQ55_1G344000 [Panicum hallii var. hallii]|uniref:Uncharacterized protein n=1 Tax=Panicum hallii var. hallii TaxID=1504633 RepID=A0A2T7FAK7_9POAL|nr:hypothetical protein GQ55_1G344000 [Panicum hallii var. hallii]